MSTQHSDGVGEVVDDLLRQALMVAARLGEIAARARQEHLAQARATSERQGRELAARFEAERGAARSSFAGVRSESWWAEADPERIGAAYKTAVSWSGQDAEISESLRHMDEQLAARGIHVTGSMPDRVTDLLRARAWVAEHDPFMDGAWTREMAQTKTAQERDRLNVALVSTWLASPEGQAAKAAERENTRNGQPKSRQDEAEDWVRENAPEVYKAWQEDGRDIDTGMGAESHAREIVTYWEKHRNDPPKSDTAQAASVEADRLRGAATREEDAANGHRLEGDSAMTRAQEWEEMPPPDMEGPSGDDMAWFAQQEQQREENVAHHEWDTADRREEFAASIHGKADQAAVDARVLADVSQGTHPRQAVTSAPRNAPKARPNNTATRQAKLTKGSR